MAKKKRNIHKRMHVVSEEHTSQVVYSERGEPVLRFGETVREGERNGADLTETVIDHLQTSSGSVLSASSLMPGPHQVSVGICDLCKKQIRRSLFRSGQLKTTLAPAVDMRRCCRCSSNLCPRHFRISRFDNRPRCLRCHRWHWLYQVIVKPVLFIE